MTPVARAICVLALMSLAAPARADPVSAVANILRQSGQFGVARGPNTVDDATKEKLVDLAHQTATKTGAKAYVVILPSGSDPAPFAANYDTLGMTGKDVLVVSNGPQWDLRCSALSAAEKQGLLDRAMRGGAKPLERMEILTGELATALAKVKTASTGAKALTWNEFQHANAGKGWNGARMSEEYQAYRQSLATSDTSTLATASTPLASGHAKGGSWLGPTFFALVVGAIVAWVLVRRRKRDANLAAEFKRALSGPESTMADVYLGMDGLEKNPNFGELMDSASAVSARIDALKAADPTRENIAKAQALSAEANRVRDLFSRAAR